MLLYPSMNELKEKADSRYTLVILTAKRARDIIAKKPVLTEFEAERPVTLAAHEIAEDLITYKRNVEPEEVPEETAPAEEAAGEEAAAEEETDGSGAEKEESAAAEA